MDERFDRLNDLLSNYSLGNFDFSLEPSLELDEIDTIIMGVNMLGEELKATTISKNYFNDIFNSVSDMVFVLSTDGKIQNFNRIVEETLGVSFDKLDQLQFSLLLEKEDQFKLNDIDSIMNKVESKDIEVELIVNANKYIPVLCSISKLKNNNNEVLGFIVIAKDITKQKETENLIIRTIVNTQENERTRVAKDLHDSLGQQLSAIKFYIGSIASTSDVDKLKELVTKSESAMSLVIKDLRNICFNLMPQTLENATLIDALKELGDKWKMNELLDIQLTYTNNIPRIDKNLEIALYRITQEFINNAIKHGNSSIIKLSLNYKNKHLLYELNDNGIGFELKSRSNGMGLKNVSSRIGSYNGKLKIKSTIGKGTNYYISVPV